MHPVTGSAHGFQRSLSSSAPSGGRRCLELLMVQGPGNAPVRSMILALKRFCIAPEDEIQLLEKGWNKYRREIGIDLNGISDVLHA